MGTIFVTKYKVYGEITQNNKIILSPHFYWLINKTLKLYFTFQAKNYAKSIFDGFLPNDDFEYIVKKIKDNFLFLAYNKEYILKQLDELGIPKEHIHSIYFCEFEFKGLLPLKLNNSSLIDVEGVVSVISGNFASNSIDLVLSSLRLSRNKINITSKTSFTFTPLLIILFILFAIEYISISNNISKNITKQSSIKNEYSLPSTSYQLKSILNKLNAMEQEQNFIREVLYKIKDRNDCTSFEAKASSLVAVCSNKTIEVRR